MPTTRVIPVDTERPDPASIAEAAEVILNGGLVAFATETVYGLGADATNPVAVARIFEAKGRPPTNPLIVHVVEKADALKCVSDWTERADRLADRFWPGPLTLVLPRSSMIPDLVTAGQETVGVRVPRPSVARRLIRKAGRPIAAPSANRSNRVSPTEARHVLKDLDGHVDMILDSGPTTLGIESTVLDLTTSPPRVLRPGEVTLEEIAALLGEPVDGPVKWTRNDEPARSPGQLDVHYAPRTPAYRFDPNQAPSRLIDGSFHMIIIGEGPDFLPPMINRVENARLADRLTNPKDAARLIYSTLHEVDELGFDFLLVVPPPDELRWRAVRDRIWRATRPWPGQV